MADSAPMFSVRRVTGSEREQLAYASSLLRDKRYEHAIEELEKVLRENENSFGANLALGLGFQGQRNFRESLPYLQKAIALDPLNPQACLLAGFSHFMLDNLDQARASFKSALDIDAKLAGGHMGLAHVALRTDDLKAATAHVKKALGLDPQLVSARILLARLHRKAGDVNAAKSELVGLLQANPGHTAASAALAMLLSQQNENEEAAQLLEAATQSEPEKKGLWATLGRVKMRLKDYEGAERAFREASGGQRGRDFFGRLRIVEALLPQGKIEEARELLEKIPRRGPLSALVHKYYGDIYAGQELYQEATQAYRAALLNSADGDKAVAEIDKATPGDRDPDWKALVKKYQAAIGTRIEEARKSLEEQDWSTIMERFQPDLWNLSGKDD